VFFFFFFFFFFFSYTFVTRPDAAAVFVNHSFLAVPSQELAKAQLPKSRFSAGFWTEMSKSKMSIGTP